MDSTFKDLGGEVRNLRRLIDPDVKVWSAFNPSIGVSPAGKYAVTLRSSNYVILETGELNVTIGDKITNRAYFGELDNDLKISSLTLVDFSKCGYTTRRGVEDLKLLWRDGGWKFTGVVLERAHTPVARQCYGALDSSTGLVTESVIHPGVEAKKPEKNWMTPYKKSPNFDYIYGPSAIVKDDKVIHTMVDRKDFTGLRGNSHLHEMKDGTYLAVMHKLWSKEFPMYSPRHFCNVMAKDKDYFHYFVRFDEYGTLIEMSKPFQFISRGIEFAMGIVEKDDSYVISFGKNDASSHLGIIKKTLVKKKLVSLKK